MVLPKFSRKTYGLTLLAGVLLLLASSALSGAQTPRIRFGPRWGGGRPTRPPIPPGARIRDLGTLDDLLEPDKIAVPYAVVEGAVVDESGKPAAGVIVMITPKDSTSRPPRTTTDKNGRYTYSGLQTGVFEMAVSYKGKVGLLVEVNLQNGRRTEINFDLKLFDGVTSELNFRNIRIRPDGDPVDGALKTSAELQSIYDKAREAAARGDFEATAALLKELVERSPNEAIFWRRLGETYIELQRYSDAAPAFRRAADLKPEVADYPALLALSLLFMGEFDEAEQHTARAASLDKTAGAQAYYNLGLALVDSGANVKAERALSKATDLDDRHSDAFLQLGVTLLSTHPNLKDAKAPLERFLKLAPGSDDAKMAEDLLAAIDKAEREGR